MKNKNINFIFPDSNSKVGTDGTIWNLPNYDGDLYTADYVNTVFLNMIGGLNGGLQTSNFEFPTGSLYDLDAASQPAITETTSLTAPTAGITARTQEKNVTQIFHEAITVSYAKLANPGRLSGINTVGATNNAADELAFQQLMKLQTIARDVHYSMLNGAYQIATSASVANKMRGMFELCASNTTVAAASADLSKALVDELLLAMFDAGATFTNTVIFVNGFQKTQLSGVYGYAPDDRNVGGVNIKQIETDFGNLGIVLDKGIPAANLGVFDLSVIAPVFQTVPNKGNLFYEELAKVGAGEKGQIFGQIGLDHGPGIMHGSITGLSTS